MLENPTIRRGGVAVLALALASLAGCAATPAPNSRPADEPPSTCGQFLAMTEDEIGQFFDEPVMISRYSAEGVTTESELDIYERECADADAETSLNDFVFGDDTYAGCADFAALSPEVQDAWREAVYQEQYYEIERQLTTAEFLDACTAFRADNLVAASNYVESYGRYTTWETETRLGYRAHLALGAGPVLTSVDGAGIDHPAAMFENPFVAGSGCGFDPATDAAIPLRILIVNTTEGQPTTLRGGFALVTSGTGLTTTAYLEANFSSGAHCSDAATRSPSDADLSVVFQEPTDAGASIQSSYFVILKNWFSPRNPDGAVGELASYRLVSTTASDEADPTISRTDASLPLG